MLTIQTRPAVRRLVPPLVNFMATKASAKSQATASSSESLNISDQILADALKRVPESGFELALTEALREKGYSDATRNLFPKGPFNLIQYHLNQQKLQLKNAAVSSDGSFSENIKTLVLHRLMGNRVLGSSSRLSEALAVMTVPSNIIDSLGFLHDLSDEITWLAGDKSNDFSWYIKRLVVSSLYATSEVFQSQDLSDDFINTVSFVNERVSHLANLKYANDSVQEWIKFNTIASYNVLKSLTRG